MRSIVHAITPGDHYSPRTGSAIPTVVHGLAGAAETDDAATDRIRHAVLLDAATFHPRYPTAEPIEYTGAPLPGLAARALDAASGRLGLPRRAAIRAFRPLAEALVGRASSFVLAHNAPVLPRLLHGSAHTPVLYAHNDILRSMSTTEAARALGDVPLIVCVSSSLADQIASRLPRGFAERIRVVENGVDTTTFTPGRRERGERLRVMFVGRTIPSKGPDVLVRAAAALARPDIEVSIVGSAGFDAAAALTPYERSLREAAASSATPVTFRSFVDREQVPGLMREADVFVVPSRWPDPNPLTVGEAMASGLAVVGSRIGGIPESLGDAGVLVEPGDADRLGAALAHLADDEEARRELATRARARAEDRSWARSWHQLREVLQHIR